MTISYVPQYIRSQEDQKSGNAITAEKWNGLFNLLIQQGDTNSEAIDAIVQLLNGLSGVSGTNPLDSRPTFPHVLDDEFDGTELNSKWSWVYSENGDLAFPTPYWTQEQLDPYTALTHENAFRTAGAPLVEAYAESHGYAVLISPTTELTDGAYAYIFYGIRPMYFQGVSGAARLYLNGVTSESGIYWRQRLVYNSADQSVTAETATTIAESAMDDYGIDLTGGFKLFAAAPFVQFQEGTGVPDWEEIAAYVGEVPTGIREAIVANSRLNIIARLRSMWFYDSRSTFLLQTPETITMPFEISTKLKFDNSGTYDSFWTGIAIRNRVTEEFLVFGPAYDSYNYTSVYLYRGQGNAWYNLNGEDVVAVPNGVWPLVQQSCAVIYLKVRLTEEGITLYNEVNGDWFEIGTTPLTACFTGYTSADLSDWDVGLAIIREDAGPYDNQQAFIEALSIDWFRVEEE